MVPLPFEVPEWANGRARIRVDTTQAARNCSEATTLNCRSSGASQPYWDDAIALAIGLELPQMKSAFLAISHC
jgi:hypothetical protein